MSERERLEAALAEAVERIDAAERDTPEFDAAHKEADDIRQQIHDLQQECDQQECDHLRHYRRSSRAYDFDSGVYGDYAYTCITCGHTWARPGAPLEVEVVMEVRAEARVDMIGYFTRLSERGRKAYAEIENDEYETYERPIAFLLSEANENGDAGGISVVPERPFPEERDAPQPATERIEVDRVEHRVTIRENRSAHMRDWTEEDFETLRSAVPWLDKVHRLLEEANGEIPKEELARIPGPLDKPLPFEEIT